MFQIDWNKFTNRSKIVARSEKDGPEILCLGKVQEASTMSYKNCNSLYWCFTIFYDDIQSAAIVSEGAELTVGLDGAEHTFVRNVLQWPDVQYLICQMELAPVTEKLHLQGYVIFKNKKRGSWLDTNLAAKLPKWYLPPHWESRKGNHVQAKAYCSKAESRFAGPWEVGVEIDEPKPGKRSDLINFKRKMDEGANEEMLATNDDTFVVWAKYPKLVHNYKMLLSEKKRSWTTFVQVYWGPPETGKSYRANQEAGPDAYWLNMPQGNQLWWDGYHGQEHVVIDEFYGWIPRLLMQRLADDYKLDVPVKGGTTPFLAKKIWITSNGHPATWWPKVGLGPMERRLKNERGLVTHMTAVFVRPTVENCSTALPPPSPPAPAAQTEQLAPWVHELDEFDYFRQAGQRAAESNSNYQPTLAPIDEYIDVNPWCDH